MLSAKLDIASPPAFTQKHDESSERPRRNESDDGPSLSLPSRSTVTALAVLFLFVTSAGAVQTTVRHEQVKIDGQRYEAAQWINEYSAQQGMEYPENYVLSKWGRNRMYNYFVNGQARSYGFAEQIYEPFLGSRNPEQQYQRLHKRVGFVVTKDLNLDSPAPADTMYSRLHHRFGSAGTDGANGVGHYRTVYASKDGSVKVFRLVPGARIVGTAPPGETVTISKEVEIDGAQFVYERDTRANPYGVYSATVPYAGEYEVKGATNAVPEGAATAGQQVKWHDREGVLHWPFDEVQNGNVYDQVGSHRGTLGSSVSVGEGVNGQSVAFDGSNGSYVETNVNAPQQFTISAWVNPSKLDTSEGNDYRQLVRGKSGSLLILEQNGQVSFRVPGVSQENYVAGQIPLGQWTYVTATYNGSHRTIYVDGEQVGTNRIGNGTVDWGGQLHLGNDYADGSAHAFNGALDEVRIDGRALTPQEVRERYEAYNETSK